MGEIIQSVHLNMTHIMVKILMHIMVKILIS